MSVALMTTGCNKGCIINIYKVMAAITGKGARGRRENKGITSGKIS